MAKRRALSNYLKMFRKRSGLSQEELGFLLGGNFGTQVARFECGRRTPSFEALVRYEIIFKATALDLFTGAHERLADDVCERARKLHRELDAVEPFTPAVKQKLEFLVDLMYPPRKRRTKPAA